MTTLAIIYLVLVVVAFVSGVSGARDVGTVLDIIAFLVAVALAIVVLAHG